MRATWIVLLLLAVLPSLLYPLLLVTGGTESLRFIATTNWQPGDPSVGELFLFALSLLTWLWWRLMLPVLVLAALPFIVGDVWRWLRGRGGASNDAAVSDGDASTAQA